MFVLRTGSSQIKITDDGEIGEILRLVGELGVIDVEFNANAWNRVLSRSTMYSRLFFVSNVSPDADPINSNKLKHKINDSFLVKVQMFN